MFFIFSQTELFFGQTWICLRNFIMRSKAILHFHCFLYSCSILIDAIFMNLSKKIKTIVEIRVKVTIWPQTCYGFSQQGRAYERLE